MVQQGMRPDLITFADVGAERRKTYAFRPLMDEYLARHGFPPITICEYNPKPKTLERYRLAVLEVVARLGLRLDPIGLARLSRLYGNMVANKTLPGQAFGFKSCSFKWKLEAQEPT
jgi:hypothetical protein